VIDKNLGSKLANKLKDVQGKIETAMEELAKAPPDYKAALRHLKEAVHLDGFAGSRILCAWREQRKNNTTDFVVIKRKTA
jgi:hypothetical protein